MTMIVDINEVLIELGLSASCTELERAIAQAALRKATGAVLRHLKYDPTLKTHTVYHPNNDFRRQGRQAIWEVNDTEAYVRYLSEYVSNELQLQHLPIRSVISVNIDYDGRSGTRSGSFGASTLKIEGVDFWPNYDSVDSQGNKVCMDGILRSLGVWPDLAGSVKVVYTAGYTDKEIHGQDEVIDASPIMEAVIDESVRRVLKVNSRKKNRLAGFVGPLTSESLGDYSYSSNTGIMDRLVGGTMDLLPETEQKLNDFCRYDLEIM